MDATTKSRARRTEIRKNRPDACQSWWTCLRNSGTGTSLGVAAVFAVLAALIISLHTDVMPFRPGQAVQHDIFARVDFSYTDLDRLADQQREARDRFPRTYKPAGDIWSPLRDALTALPDRLAANDGEAALPPAQRDILDSGTLTALRQEATERHRGSYAQAVKDYVQALADYRDDGFPLVLLDPGTLKDERSLARDAADRGIEWKVQLADGGDRVPADRLLTPGDDRFRNIATAIAHKFFPLSLEAKIPALTAVMIRPNYAYDPAATNEQRNLAEQRVSPAEAQVSFSHGEVIVRHEKGTFDQKDWARLKAENAAYIAQLGPAAWWAGKLGSGLLVAALSAVLAAYISLAQPRVPRSPVRAAAIAGLLLAMLVLSESAGLGSGQLLLFGVAPAVLAAMILSLAYDRRFALGVAAMLGVLVTLGLGQGAGFFVTLTTGVATAALLMNDVRNRSKLIEVGGCTAVAMMATTLAAGAAEMQPLRFVAFNALYAGAAGLSCGFVVLGILPIIEKWFRITTSITLLEAADASHPLLRRLAIEAPGTYSHSLQVATLAENAAEAIGANSLLCRVASYFHDAGKINKPDYFVENQADGQSRHINLSPSVSLLIIIGHVKDGMELAKEYGLPANILPFIQQHHGTTLVEYFYHRACTRQQEQQPAAIGGPEQQAVSEAQYRYPGPKPQKKEAAIVMLADAVESACRSLLEPTSSRVETLVHDLTMKRLLDGQFDECNLTMRELERIERSLVKTLLSLYHGRIAYPPAARPSEQPAASTLPGPAMRMA